MLHITMTQLESGVSKANQKVDALMGVLQHTTSVESSNRNNGEKVTPTLSAERIAGSKMSLQRIQHFLENQGIP